MSVFVLGAGVACVLAWFYLLLGRGGFWQIRKMGAPERSTSGFNGSIAIVIPARNEADVIGQAVNSLLLQSGVGLLHIFIVDDHSTDGTAEAARQAAQSSPQAAAVSVISGSALPEGWTGKLWAMQQGIEQAARLNPDFVLLTDADIEHAAGNLATLVGTAEAGGYDLTSFMVKLHCRSLPEQLLIPAFVFFFLLLYPPQWIRDPRRKTAGAAGGCMLIRPSALDRIGGIGVIRQQIIDDCALAGAVKKSGGKVWLGVTAETRSLRPYNSLGEIESMISRTAFNQLRHSAWLLLGTVLGMMLIYLVPLMLLASQSELLLALGVAACVTMLTMYLPMVRFYGLNPLWALTLPVSAAFYVGATVHSAVKYWSGRGGEWKGRSQDGIGAQKL